MAELLILSPHRDDAVFSLAVSIRGWSNYATITVVNFFTTSSYAPHAASEDRSLANLSRLRRLEDRLAIRKLSPGIRVIDEGLLDAPVRLRTETAAVSGPDAVASKSSDIQSVAVKLRALKRFDCVVAPLGLGNHVDHRTVRQAALEVFAPSKLAFYEDLPYATWTPKAEIRRVIDVISRTTGRALLSHIVHGRLSMRAKQLLCSLYATQITTNDAFKMARFGARHRGGERVWIPNHSRAWAAMRR